MRIERLAIILVIVATSIASISAVIGQTTPPETTPPTGSPTAIEQKAGPVTVGGPTQSATTAPVVATVTSPAVEILKACAWPLAALVIAAVFRRPIVLFMTALGSRITKLSVFKVELELVPATAVTTTPLLDDIRTATNPAMISDSSRVMLEQVKSGDPADFATIALGHGEEWLTSRLYIAAVMMERMRGVKVFVFVESAPNTTCRFVALASVRQLRWALARRFPWLEAAFARVQLSVFPPTAAGAPGLPDPRTLSMPQSAFQSDTGGLEPWRARSAVQEFIGLVQSPAGPQPDENEWVTLEGGMTKERATWVTRELLSSMLPQEAFSAWAPALRDAPRAQRTRAVLRRANEFVALIEENREFVRLANRHVLLEDIAAPLSEEPET